MLESCNGELKIMMVKMLRALMEEEENTLEQMGNVRREMETLRKNFKNVRNKKHYNRNEECPQWTHL